jgi:hypothetical protein
MDPDAEAQLIALQEVQRVVRGVRRDQSPAADDGLGVRD